MTDRDTSFEKKSDRIEIRVSHSKKQAFNAACENQGDIPSNALRRFIDGYIRRADKDAFHDGLRAFGRMAQRRWLPLSVVAAALLVSGYFTGQALRTPAVDGPKMTASIDTFPPINYALFAAYDKNANGVLDLGEITDDDSHLHRVLNLDGEAGIAPAEFYAKGKMQWAYIKKGSVETSVDDNGSSASYINEGEPTVVDFDLSDPLAPTLLTRPVKKTLRDKDEKSGTRFFGLMRYHTTSEVKVNEPVDRTVSWERGAVSPALVFSNHDFRTRDVDAT